MNASTVIYVRTPQGRAVAFSPDTALPAALKAMLKAVDGKLNAQALQDKFASEPDPAKLLAQLLEAELIMDRGTAWPKVQFNQGNADFEQSFVQSQGSLLEASASQPPQASAQAFTHSAAKAENNPQPVWSDTSPSGLDNLASAPSFSLLDRMAQQTADEMCTFVLTHVPAKAFGMLAEIETIKTPDQLKSYMPDYELELAQIGAPGQAHLQEIKQILQKLF